MTTRRELFALSATTVALAGLQRYGVAAALRAYPESRYAQAMVIDALGEPGGPNPPGPDFVPLSAQDLADVKKSGVSAVNLTVSEDGNAPDRFERTIENIAAAEHELATHPDLFLKVLRGRDLVAAKTSGRLGLIYGFQDTNALEGDLKRMTLFHDLGVRIAQPTYNRRNLMGDGCLESADGGLSELGRQFIAELNRLQIVLDLSHAGPRTIAEGISACRGPMAITHAGCRAFADLPRNVADRELRALADKGGVVGIYFMPFLRDSGQPHAQDVIRHLEYAVRVCGEDHVGVGTDGSISGVEINDTFRAAHRKFIENRRQAGVAAPGESEDVFNLIPEYNDPRRFKTLADDLAGFGWPDARIEKILGGNFARLFTAVWGN